MKCILHLGILLAVTLVAACNLTLVSVLREQLAEPERFFALSREREVCWLHFKVPVIERKHMAGLGLPGGNEKEDRVRRTYLLQLNEDGPRPVEVEFKFSHDRLVAIAIPVIFHEVLGSHNIMNLLRVAGGHTLEKRSIDPISAGVVRVALTRANTATNLASSTLVINLISTVVETPSLALRLARRPGKEDFQNIHLSLKPQPLPAGNGTPGV